MLINAEMLTLADILRFIRMINTTTEKNKQETSLF